MVSVQLVNNMKLTVVYSTRKIDETYIKHIENTCGVKGVEVLPFENPDGVSLTEVYNELLEKAQNDIVVFCHDDLIFNTKKWGKKILKHFDNSDYGVLGLAGTTELPETGRWWEDINQPLSNMVGLVNHSQDGKTWESKYSMSVGENIIPVVMLDGLFFAVDKTKIESTFNEEIKGFHFYDVDFTFSNHLDGVKVGVVTNVRVTHKSVGQTNEEWEKNRLQFVKEKSTYLPASVGVEIFYTEKIPMIKNQPKPC